MADVNLTHTGAQLDAAIATVLAGGGGTISHASGAVETDSLDSFTITGLSFTPKMLLWSLTNEGTPFIFTTEYIDSLWLTSFLAFDTLMWQNPAMDEYISATDGSITVNIPDSLPIGTTVSYSVWG